MNNTKEEDTTKYGEPIYTANCMGITEYVFTEYLKENNARFLGRLVHQDDLYDLSMRYIDERSTMIGDSIQFQKLFQGFGKNEYPSRMKDEKQTYLMIDYNTGYYKIGRSVNPSFREGTLQSKKPTIELICTCKQDIETDLHQLFDSKRIRGEWFDLSEADLKYIKKEFEKHNK